MTETEHIDNALDNAAIDDENEGYQILITNISWNPSESSQSYQGQHKKHEQEDLPAQFTLNVPENVLNQANKKKNVFEDVIESYVYNFLTHKFKHEVYFCQIWLPLADEVQS